MRNWNTYRLPGDPNLPGGCTDADVDRAMGGDIGEEDCDNCDGTGLMGVSECCEGSLSNGKCETCGEEANELQCPQCDGKGYVTFSISERREAAREEALIDHYEDARQDRLCGRD